MHGHLKVKFFASVYILCLHDVTRSGTEVPHCLPFTMNAAVDWLVLPLVIRYVPCSDLGPNTSFRNFPSMPPPTFPDITSNFVTSVFCHVGLSASINPTVITRRASTAALGRRLRQEPSGNAVKFCCNILWLLTSVQLQ